jgi:hypothetical protein
LDELDKDSLDKMKFAMKEAEVAVREIAIDIAASGEGSVGSATFGLMGAGDIVGGKKLNSSEARGTRQTGIGPQPAVCGQGATGHGRRIEPYTRLSNKSSLLGTWRNNRSWR